jgi:hypothetical protein
VTELAHDHGIPESTLRAIIAAGVGPRTFNIGRLIFCRRADWIAWLDEIAQAGGTGRLSFLQKHAG